MRRAVLYVSNREINLQNVSDDDFLRMDMCKDLRMGNIRMANVAIELERVHGFDLPMKVFYVRKNDTIGEFINAVNQCLAE